MKRLIFPIILLICNSLIAQNTPDTRTFENLENHLYKTEIIKLDSTKISTLKNNFKNIVSALLANFKESKVSETENQIVLSYVMQTISRPSTYWNVRLIAQFKVGKMRLRIYDEGNVYIPASQYTPTWPEGSFYVTNNKRAVKKLRNKALNEWMNENDNFLKEIKEGMKNTANNDNW